MTFLFVFAAVALFALGTFFVIVASEVWSERERGPSVVLFGLAALSWFASIACALHALEVP